MNNIEMKWDNEIKFGDRLEELKKEKGITQKACADVDNHILYYIVSLLDNYNWEIFRLAFKHTKK